MSEKIKFAFYLTPEEKAELEHRYTEDGSTSQTAFVQNALRFYLDYLNTQNAGQFLPDAVRSVIDGRLGMFEHRLSAQLFKLTVEHEMGLRTLTDCVNLDEGYLQQQRTRSVKSVKATNGQLSFEKIAREVGEDGCRV